MIGPSTQAEDERAGAGALGAPTLGRSSGGMVGAEFVEIGSVAALRAVFPTAGFVAVAFISKKALAAHPPWKLHQRSAQGTGGQIRFTPLPSAFQAVNPIAGFDLTTVEEPSFSECGEGMFK